MKDETRLQRAKRHMRVAGLSGASALSMKTGHVHTTARAQREQKGDASPEGFDSQP